MVSPLISWWCVFCITSLMTGPRETCGQVIGCAGGSTIISRDPSITPPGLVTASDYLTSPSSPPANVLNFGYNGDDFRSWCTDTNDPNPYIIIQFSSPVVITSFISSGATDFSSSVLDHFHVTNFTLEYKLNNTHYEYYTTEDDLGDRKYFLMNQSQNVVWFELEMPIVADSIRLVPISWYDSETTFYQYICHGVGLFGCSASKAIFVTTEPQQQTTIPMTTNEIPVSTLATTQQSNTQELSSALPIVFVKDYQTLAIGLPIALITIIIVTLLVIVGVIVCLKLALGKGSSSRYDIEFLETSQTPLDPRTSVLDNSVLYGRSSPQRPDWREGTVRHCENELYGADTDNNYQVILSEDGEDTEPIYTDADYEFIKNPDYSENDDHDSHDDREDSLECNSAYNSVYVESLSEGDPLETPVVKEDFTIVRNDSYEDPTFDGEYEFPNELVDTIYEETTQ